LKNPKTGRNGLTAQQVLRSLALQRVKNWNYLSPYLLKGLTNCSLTVGNMTRPVAGG
jgi:hypothetical protein